MIEFSRQYFELLTNEFKGINLTRITDFEEFYNKQILDSLLPIESSKNFKKDILEKKLVIDVGFGGGFPILPLAFKFPDIQFVGFEARKKKADVVRIISQKLNLKNVKLFHQRLEDVVINKEVVITFKAVSEIESLLKKINTTQLVKAYFYKGPNVKELEKVDGMFGWSKEENVFISVPYADGRTIISYKNKDVPRGTIKSKNKVLVNLTNLI